MDLKKACLIIFSILIYLSSYCQFETLRDSILSIDSFNTNYSREKIFIHYDRPYYNLNDTLWLKGYILSAKNLEPDDSSKIVYIEIINSSGEVIHRVSTYSSGVFFCSIALNKSDFTQGSFLLRAYTNYMRNYGDSSFFESSFKIIDPTSSQWNLSVHNISLLNDRFVLNADVQPTSKQNSSPQELTLILQAKNKIYFKQKIETGRNGSISVDTLLAKESNKDSLQLKILNGDNVKTQIPVYPNKEQKIDVQFLPEGGSFIANKVQRLGIKALDIFGNGINIKGKIENSKKQEVATFSTIHDGMGIVELTPDSNEKYFAILDNGLIFQLPEARQSGTQLQVINSSSPDSLMVVIDASPDLYNKEYFFRASANGISCAMGAVHFKNAPYKLSISKEAFPSSICRFTVYNSDHLPVNERVVLIWHHDNLRLNMILQKTSYGTRDSVHVLVTANDPDKQPVVGSFSVAVVDTGRVHYAQHSENILSYMLLSSDLNGKIEDPSYYFDSPLPEATDALMLTQGWVQYNHFLSKPLFNHEKEFTIPGKVTNLLGKPVGNVKINLFGKDGKTNSFFLDTVSDNNGRFVFTDFPVFNTDSVNLVINALNKRGKQFGIGVDVIRPVFPAYTRKFPGFLENITYDTSAAMYVHQQTKLYRQLQTGKEYLPEVIVTTTVRIPGSKNLNADGGSDQVITPKILEKMSKKNLLDVLSNQLAGFHRGTLLKSPLQLYLVNGDIVIFVIDGYNIVEQYQPTSGSFTEFAEYEESYLRYLAAEDVAGIEIMTKRKHTFAYEKYYNLESNVNISFVFIEITTYSGNGAFAKRTPGQYLYKPLSPVTTKTFYSPRYGSDDTLSSLPDYRSTVYWKPDIVTDEKGEAEFSFYTSDSDSGYLLILQGVSLDGQLGFSYLPLSIKKEAKPAANR